MRVRVKKGMTCYYGDRIYKEGSIVEFNETDMAPLKINKGKKNEKKLYMPSWAEPVGDSYIPPTPTRHDDQKTLSEISKSQGMASENLKKGQDKLADEREAFEKEKKEYKEKASKKSVDNKK